MFCVRRSIDALDSENQPGHGKIRTGFRALELTEDVWYKKYGNEKEGLQNCLEYAYNSIFNIPHRSGIWPKPDPQHYLWLMSIH